MKSLGTKLKELRIERGYSQGDLCKEINNVYGTSINKGMISKWENDKEEPRLDYARILVSFFNVSLDFLIGLEDEENKEMTIAAHHDGEEFTEEELLEIENFKKYILSKRNE